MPLNTGIRTDWPERVVTTVLVLGAVVTGLYAASLYSFLLFHTVVEMATIAVLFGIFLIAWNTRHLVGSHYLLFVGTASVFVAGITLLHTLAYRGMGVFNGDTSNLATQLWIAAQYLLAVSLLAAVFFTRRRLNGYLLLVVYTVVTALLLMSIFTWGVFPDCYVPGHSANNGYLTDFKIASEYIISALLAAAAALLWFRRKDFSRGLLWLLIASVGFMALSELSFTTYISVYGPAILVGHLLRVVAFALLYKAIIQTSLKEPYRTLFRDVEQSRRQLQLKVEELELALKEVKTLSGLLPICSGCKKIRQDDGYWQQIEHYIAEHSDAQFSHGLCEECSRELYPELFRTDVDPTRHPSDRSSNSTSSSVS